MTQSELYPVGDRPLNYKISLTYAEAAEATGHSVSVIRRAVRCGDLVAHFPTAKPVLLVEDVVAWVGGTSAQAPPPQPTPARQPVETSPAAPVPSTEAAAPTPKPAPPARPGRKTARRQSGDGSLCRRESDGLWIATVELNAGPDGKRRRKVVSSKSYETAAKKLRDLRRQVEDAGGDIPTASILAGPWLETWLTTIAAPRLRPKTLIQYRGDVRLHIVPVIGRYRLDKLTPQHVRQMHSSIIAKGLSSTTALRCHAVLSKALTDAMRDGLITRNVATLVDRPRVAPRTQGALTAEQGRKLLATVASQPMGSRWAAALLTGARQGELLGLERDRVGDVLDLSWQLQRLPYMHTCGTPTAKVYPCRGVRAGSCPKRKLEVPPGFEYRQLHGSLSLVRPKSVAGHRIVPLVEPLRTIIERHIAATDHGPHGLVWSDRGKPIQANQDSKAWHAALQAADLPPVPLHAARHTTATLLLEAGVDAHVIMSILGHSSVVVSRGYQHVDRRLTTDALGRLSLALEHGVV